MSDKTIDELAKTGIFIGSDFVFLPQNQSNIGLTGKRKNFSADSKCILLGKTIKGRGKIQ